DPVGRDIAIEIQVAGEAASARAILNGILEAVEFNRIASRVIRCRQTPPSLYPVPDTCDLPAANELFHDAAGIAKQFLPAPDWQFSDEIPTDLVFRSIGIAFVVQETVSCIEVRWNRTGQIGIQALHRVQTLRVVRVPIDQHRVPVVPEELESKPFVE